MMNENNFYHVAAKLGLIKFSESAAFANRNKLGGRHFIIDSRGSGSNPELLNMLISALENGLRSLPDFDTLAGIAHSGTPWAAMLAFKLQMPFCNVLKEHRQSGMQRQIEGDVASKRVLLVDNWINTGESVLLAADIIRRNGGEPVAVLAISGELQPKHLDIPLAYALQIDKLIVAANQQQLIPASLIGTLLTNKD